MRPIELHMTAFGPYREQETIDFSQLQAHTLFVIAGPTGAGKTSIFDALSFALFGTGSGEDRQDTRMLRSDFAPDDLHTSVELTFQVRGKTYRIFRQMAHTKTGNKTATGEKYELVEQTTGGDIPLVERYTVREINAKLMELVGMTADQFHQIVMLPQGEFRKFLTSSTDQKEVILRKLFRTERFQKMNDYLKDKRQQLVDSSQQHRAVLASLVHQAAGLYPEEPVFLQAEINLYQIDQAFQQGIHQVEEAYRHSTEAEKSAWTTYSEQQKTLQHMEWMAAKKNRLKELTAKKQTLTQNQQVIDSVKKQVEAATRAQSITHFYLAHQKIQQQINTKQHLLETLKAKLESTLQTFKLVEESWQALRGQEDKRQELRRYLDRLQEVIVQLEQREQLIAQERQLAAEKEQKESLVKKLKQEQQQTEERLQQLRDHYQALSIESSVLPEHKEKVGVLKEQLRQLHHYEVNQTQAARLTTEIAAELTVKQQVSNELEAFKQQQTNQLALQLASHLHDGMPCPVCGSQEHPEPAQDTQPISGQSLADIEHRFSEATARHLRLTIEHERVAQDITAFEKDHKEIQHAKESLQQELEKETSQIALLEDKRRQADHCITQGKPLREQSDRYKAQLPTHEQQVAKVTEDWQRLQGQLQSMQKLATDWTLTGAKQEATTKSQQLERDLRQWRETDQEYGKTKEHYQALVQQHQWETDQLKQLQQEGQQSTENWSRALTEKGFLDEAMYQQAVLPEQQLTRFQHEIQEHDQALQQVTTELTILAQELEGQEEERSVEEQQQMVRQAKEAWDTLKEQSQQLQGKRQATERLTTQLATLKDKMGDVEAKLAATTALYDALRGHNAKKISFERYMLIAYLEQITEAANQRLQTLSGGQFRLVRSDRQESHGKQSGLQLDVYDGYTGQFRDVKSLSGGEKFHASLSLALGMADVMQEMNGGIQIETMFIDEGFGSLDEESLQKAIDALVQLQRTGRLIGVISHVKELQAAIPAQLSVRKSSSGISSTQFQIG